MSIYTSLIMLVIYSSRGDLDHSYMLGSLA
jgi:hypothetical protein